jgi:hypothetical protein
MLTLEMAIQKIQQLPPEQQNKIIEFIEKLESQSNQGANAQISQKPETIFFTENDCVEDDEEFEAIADDVADELQRYLGSTTPVLSDYAVRRSGIYQDYS